MITAGRLLHESSLFRDAEHARSALSLVAPNGKDVGTAAVVRNREVGGERDGSEQSANNGPP